MKNSLTMKLNLFLSLLFLSIISPLFLGNSDANAVNTCVVTNGTGTCTLSADQKTCTAAGGATCTLASSDDNAFTRTLCNALRIITGTGGKAFAAFAIISLGIGFFTGKVSWGLMVGVTAGIAAMFGAPTIVAAISGTSTGSCSNTAVM